MIPIHSLAHLAIVAAISLAAFGCSPSQKTADPDWIRFDPVMADKPMPTIWIAPAPIKVTAEPFSSLIVLDRTSFRDAVDVADASCALAKRPLPLNSQLRYYSIIRSDGGRDRTLCDLSQTDSCSTAERFREVAGMHGYSELLDAFDNLKLRLGC